MAVLQPANMMMSVLDVNISRYDACWIGATAPIASLSMLYLTPSPKSESCCFAILFYGWSLVPQ